MQRYRRLADEAQLQRDRKQAAHRRWKRIAYPLYGVPQPRDVLSDGSAS